MADSAMGGADGDLAPLLAVRLLFRAKDGFSSLCHVVDAVSLFLDSSVDLPLAQACQFGSLKLLDRIWRSSVIFASDKKGVINLPWSPRRYLCTGDLYRRTQLRLSLIEAILLKNLDMIRWLLDKIQGVDIDAEVVLRTMGTISIDVLELIYGPGSDHSVEVYDVAMAEAISEGRHDVVWWMQQNLDMEDFNLSEALMRAVRNEDIVTAEWLYDKGATWRRASPGDNIGHEIAAKGRLDILKWLSSGGKLDEGAVVKAAGNGHLHVVRLLMEPVLRGAEPLEDLSGEAVFAIHAAAINGHLNVAKYLRERTKALSGKEQRSPAMKEQLEHLSRELGSPNEAAIVSAETMTSAARNGHLEVVRWLYEELGNDNEVNLFNCSKRGGSAHATAMDAAAGNGHLEVLTYLHELQQSFDLNARKRKREKQEKLASPQCTEAAMDDAAAGGHLNVVHWLHQNRTEGSTTRAMDQAATGGHLHVVKWLVEHRSEKCTTAAIDGAAAKGHLNVVQWLHFNTDAACTTAAMDGAAAIGRLDIVEWLHEHRREGCTPAAMDRAAGHGALNLVKWLHSNRAEGCTEEAMGAASANGHLKIVRWLAAHRSEGNANLAIEAAASSDHFDVFLFLHDKCGAKCCENTALVARDHEAFDIAIWIASHYPDIHLHIDW